jgi:subtilisin family serine protease
VGVNWRITILAGKFLGPVGGSVADAVTAIDYFTDLKLRHGLKIVALNNSWGGGFYSQALHDAILRAARADILFVAAAGNGLPLLGLGLNNDLVHQYPSNYDTSTGTSTESAAAYNAIIAVAAIDSNGALASFSNYGSRSVHLGRSRREHLFDAADGWVRRVQRHLDGHTSRYRRHRPICFCPPE